MINTIDYNKNTFMNNSEINYILKSKKENIVFCNEIILYFLNQDYKIRSNLLYELSQHIELLYDYYVITSDDRIKIVTMANNTLNELNKYYNKISDTIYKKNNKVIESNNSEEELNNNKQLKPSNSINWLNNKNLKQGIQIFEILRRTKTTNIFNKGLEFFDYKEIDNLIKHCYHLIGSNKLENILYIHNFDIAHLKSNDRIVYDILNLIARPINCKYIISKRIDKKILHFEFLENNICDEKYDLLLGNLYKIKIRSKDFKYLLEIDCFIINECLNTIVRTSSICNNYIYNKKQEIVNYINKKCSFNVMFKRSYIKNLNITDLLLTNIDNNFKKKMIDDYAFFIRCSSLNFKNIMIEFLQSPLKVKFNMIKILLHGNPMNINVAALLYGITKDQKDAVDNMSKPTLVSDLIFRSLKYSQQNKLKKSNSLINQELEKLKNIIPEDIDLKKQILMNKNMPTYVKKLALNRLEELKSSNSEHYKHQTYIRKLIDFPWIDPNNDDDIFSIVKNDFNECKKFIDNAKNKMNEYVYGHNKCKETIIELIGKWISNPNSSGKSIGLLGPPGVGKTLFAKALGQILNVPFSQINLGGVDDASLLTGHSFTYSSAQNGLIIDNIIKGGSPRCILFFDEIDKTGIKHGVNEIMNVLIHLTDPNSNDKFNDKFFQEVTFPLNKVLFVFSYNDADKVDKILLDRLEQITVDAYTTVDKLEIFKNHLIQEVCKDIDMDNNILYFPDEVIVHIIDNYTHEAGVRSLKRKLEKLMNKINLDKLYQSGLFKNNNYDHDNKINITIDLVDKYLEKSSLNPKRIFHTPQVGVVNGMYAVSSGPGGILPILIYKHFTGSDNFKLRFTGQQKDIMKESIKFAFTTAMNLIKDNYIEVFLKKYSKGLHIHTPDGSTPKDGPSAGSAFTTAFISVILNKKIKNDISMTGEIETDGYITAIGGLECKLLGAKKAGVKLVFIPKENEIDYNKIIDKNKNLIDNNFKVMIVEHIREILDYALIDDAGDNNKDKTYNKTFNNNIFIK